MNVLILKFLTKFVSFPLISHNICEEKSDFKLKYYFDLEILSDKGNLN